MPKGAGPGKTIDCPSSIRRVERGQDDSPVAQLARRRDKNGEPLLSLDQIEAANRLCRTFERAHMQPRLTMAYGEHLNRHSRKSGAISPPADQVDGTLAARNRVERALEAIGSEFAGIVIDICCYQKGLETVERERQWPARSAKLVLSLALKALARFYGMSGEAAGPSRSNAIVHWGSNDYRPTIS